MENGKDPNELDVLGWSKKGGFIQPEFYDKLFNSSLEAKGVIFRGRGKWDTCRCPKKGSVCGEQFDNVQPEDITNIEYIHITSTFEISACALLDLVSRSPKLKALKFYGMLDKHDHCEAFRTKRFYSDLDKIYWPWPNRKHLTALTILAKRNENLSTFYSTSQFACDLLAAEALPKVRFLSLILSENWECKPKNYKKAHKFLKQIEYISQAKNVEGLEVRTFELDCEIEDKETKVEIGRIYENYRLNFWKHVAKLPNLKYLAVYGAWEFEEVSREMEKNNLQIEFLRINLMPKSIIEALENGDDTPVLSMASGLRNLRKLIKLRSLHFICYEKLLSIDKDTTAAFKELVDKIWILDIKTSYTTEVEDLLNNIMRRANQIGKTYKVLLHIQAKDETKADLLMEPPLKVSHGSNSRIVLNSMAMKTVEERYGDSNMFDSFHIWGLEQINSRDEAAFQNTLSNWSYYEEKFYQTPRFI